MENGLAAVTGDVQTSQLGVALGRGGFVCLLLYTYRLHDVIPVRGDRGRAVQAVSRSAILPPNLAPHVTLQAQFTPPGTRAPSGPLYLRG